MNEYIIIISISIIIIIIIIKYALTINRIHLINNSMLICNLPLAQISFKSNMEMIKYQVSAHLFSVGIQNALTTNRKPYFKIHL